MPIITILPSKLDIAANSGDTLYRALRSQGMETNAECNGMGKCGICKIAVD